MGVWGAGPAGGYGVPGGWVWFVFFKMVEPWPSLTVGGTELQAEDSRTGCHPPCQDAEPWKRPWPWVGGRAPSVLNGRSFGWDSSPRENRTEGSLGSPRGAHRCGPALLGPLHGRTGRVRGSRLSQAGVPPSGLRHGATEEWQEGRGCDRWQGSGAGVSEGLISDSQEERGRARRMGGHVCKSDSSGTAPKRGTRNS